MERVKRFSRFASLILTATIFSPFGAIQAKVKSNSLYSPKITSLDGILISFDLDYEAKCHEISKEIRKNNKEAENFDEYGYSGKLYKKLKQAKCKLKTEKEYKQYLKIQSRLKKGGKDADCIAFSDPLLSDWLKKYKNLKISEISDIKRKIGTCATPPPKYKKKKY